MSSTYSPSLRIQLIDTGTELEAWGTPTDNNLGTIIEQAIVGSNTISLTNLTSYTLTTANAAVDEARNAVLVFNGALTANCNVIAPSVQKVYVVSNQTTGGKFVNIKTATGNAISVVNGTNQLIYCTGTDFVSAVNINNIIGNLTISGNSTVGGNVTVGSNVVIGNALTGTSGNLVLQSTTSNLINFQGTTGALIPPYGTTAQRPSSPVVGMSRWNTDYGWYEIWNGIIWQNITGTYDTNYLIVAAGGSGGFGIYSAGGGGGGGGYIAGTIAIQAGTAYTITVGAGGAGSNGGNSTAFGLTAIGGGMGGGQYSTGTLNGNSGGSGGGGSTGGGSGGSGTSGQGYAGSAGGAGGGIANTYSGGGGGGASGVGVYKTAGNGISSAITGTNVYYAGGGGGGGADSGAVPSETGGTGGLGGGGHGQDGNSGSGNQTAGTANTGGGGGGSISSVGISPGGNKAGGSGVVIISYISSYQRATGGTVTTYTSGGNTYYVHTFTSSGTLTA